MCFHVLVLSPPETLALFTEVRRPPSSQTLRRLEVHWFTSRPLDRRSTIPLIGSLLKQAGCLVRRVASFGLFGGLYEILHACFSQLVSMRPLGIPNCM